LPVTYQHMFDVIRLLKFYTEQRTKKKKNNNKGKKSQMLE